MISQNWGQIEIFTPEIGQSQIFNNFDASIFDVFSKISILNTQNWDNIKTLVLKIGQNHNFTNFGIQKLMKCTIWGLQILQK